jgi:hypothetical protein
MSTLCAFLITTATLVAGCAGAGDPGTDPEEPAAPAAPRSQGTALQIERAGRSLDVGRDLAGARAALEQVLADPAITPEQRDEARLGLSRALEAGGDREGAIAAVEALLADHPDAARFPLEEVAAARLRKLVTGNDAEPPRHVEKPGPVSPFARVLARDFPAPTASKASVEVRLQVFGGSEETSARLGTFAIDRALHELRREACPFCDDHLSITQSSGWNGSWVDIPRYRAKIPRALTVFYFDLGAGRIPARYDADLPLPSAEIAARLAKGDGLVAARERPGAPPVLLIAAPRDVQLAQVEEALAAMKTLPTEPVAVPVNGARQPEEIQAVVRASFGAFRQCYEAVLKVSPAATGTVKMHFVIRQEGSVEGVSAVADGPLHDAAFERCMTSAVQTLAFPAAPGGKVTVTYPIVFSP